MSEALKERKEMDPQYQWDLTKMYASDAEWEKAFAAIDPKIEALAAWEGKLNNAASIREFYDAEIGVFRELENLAVYTSLRLSEDTRADDAQSMDARATAKYVKAVGTIAYAQPEILALPQETLPLLQQAFSRAFLIERSRVTSLISSTAWMRSGPFSRVASPIRSTVLTVSDS